jgi:hypothetical protein
MPLPVSSSLSSLPISPVKRISDQPNDQQARQRRIYGDQEYSDYYELTSTSNLADHLNLNITVGNQVVVKDFDPSFNASNRGLAFDRLAQRF